MNGHYLSCCGGTPWHTIESPRCVNASVGKAPTLDSTTKAVNSK